ncbi:MAG: hypothetical protein HYY06_13145 [Deltaproteobacteria bacterium]|nr:hypothetical protein [Deltaproteobacteria bacterium]
MEHVARTLVVTSVAALGACTLLGLFDAPLGGECEEDADCDLTGYVEDPAVRAVCDTIDLRCRCEDADGDGHMPAACRDLPFIGGGEDCDDADPEVNPDAVELCNGRDDDCDGRVDDGPEPPAHSQASCVAGTWTVTGCADGWDDCDGDGSNGCEAGLETWRTCGSCELRCGTGDTCEAGACLEVAVAMVSAGDRHTCAVRENGAVVCWGDDASGQLGDGEAGGWSGEPVLVGALEASGVWAGGTHACAVGEDGTVSCWGANERRQLGVAQPDVTAVPIALDLSGPVSEVGAGEAHGCARLDDRSVICWGDNSDGQVGSGEVASILAPKSALLEGAEAVRLAVGARHTCVHDAKGRVICWGDNSDYQVGVPERGRVYEPREAGLSGARAVTCGGSHTCAWLGGADVRCWGRNESGQLGDGTRVGPTFVPVAVSGLAEDVVEVAAGGEHTCARTAQGTAACWGANGRGQLGDGTTEDRLGPVLVSGLEGVRRIAAAAFHTCAVLDDGGVACWGANDSGQLGDGTTDESHVPVEVLGLP